VKKTCCLGLFCPGAVITKLPKTMESEVQQHVTMQYGRKLPTFLWNVLPPSSESNKQNATCYISSNPAEGSKTFL
jgi:hypothetical protein